MVPATSSSEPDATSGGGLSRPLAVIIVTYNSAAVLPGLLNSLAAAIDGIRRVEIVVVDNASEDNSVSIAREHLIEIKVIETGRNGGYAAGINAGANAVGPEFDLLILNPDIRLSPDSARQLLKCLDDPKVGAVVPQIVGEDGRLRLSLRREPSLVTVWSEALFGGRLASRLGLGEMIAEQADGSAFDWATGAIVAISTHARHIVGSWDESFFLYSEEVDYFARLRRSGFKLVYTCYATVVHVGGDYQTNAFLTSLLVANRIRYYRRNHGGFATFLFRLGLIVGYAMRSVANPTHRSGLRTALTIGAVLPTAIPKD